MKKLCLAGILCLLAACLTSVAAAEEDKPSAVRSRRTNVVVFPAFAEDGAGQNLALGIADRAASELDRTGKFNNFHLKQVFAVARSHLMTSQDLASEEKALLAARLMGAEAGVFGKLTAADDGWKLTWTVFDLGSDKQSAGEKELAEDAAAAVREGGRAQAAAIMSLLGMKPPAAGIAHPDTDSGPAMQAYLSCYRVIINQSMGLRKSHVIRPAVLTDARSDCLQAVKEDPDFSAAWAALSLVYSLAFKQDDAARALQKSEAQPGLLALRNIARYWFKTRFEGSRQGAKVMSESAEKHPGALIFWTYLGEHLNITRQYEKALQVWNNYLEMVPASPFAMAQKGYCLARLSRLNESITITTKACKADACNMDLQLELASRLVDAGQLDGAQSILEPLIDKPGVFGEVVLRLGYVYLLKDQNDKAEKYFKKALDMARGPHEWRTRGRARYDLAIVMARKGKLEKAEKYLLDAAWEGFAVRDVLTNNPDLQVLAKRPAVVHLFEGKTPRRRKLRLHTTPFPVDYSGKVMPEAKRTPPSMTGINF